MNQMIDGMLARLPTEAKTERDLVAAALQIPVNLAAKTAAVRVDADLSEQGKASKIRSLASGDALNHFRQLCDQAKAMGTDVANLKKALQPKEPDRGDMTAEMRRDQIRNYVRTLPEGQRLRFVLDNEAVSVAVIDQLPELSGLNAELFDRVKQAHVERLYGNQLAGLAKREEIVEVVNSAIQIATREFVRESGLSEREIAL